MLIDLKEHGEEAELISIVSIRVSHLHSDPKCTQMFTCDAVCFLVVEVLAAHPVMVLDDKIGQNLEGCVPQISRLAILWQSIEAQPLLRVLSASICTPRRHLVFFVEKRLNVGR